MRHLLFSVFVLSLSMAPVRAQDTLRTPSEPPEWGEVTPQLLRADAYPADSNASAVIISDQGVVSFQREGKLNLERQTRIKILDESGYDAGTKKVQYYAADDLQEVKGVEGRTYTLENGKIRTHELEDEDVFEEDVDGEYGQVRFTLPELEPGAVIEYKYELESKSYLHIPSWNFQHAHPTLYSEYEVNLPDFLEYATITTGLKNYDSVKEDTRQTPDMGEVLTTTWVMKDVPALREEPYMTTTADYRSRLRLQVRTFYHPETGRVVEKYMTSWADLAETQMEADYFGNGLGEGTGGFLSGDDLVGQEVKNLTKGLSSDSAKTQAVYDYVRSSIEWNGELRRSREKGFQQIFESKSGNSAELNLLLVSMLQLAGLDAHPVMISTRDHGQVYRAYPLVTQFNSVIAAVHLPGRSKPMLLDATAPLCPPGLLPERDLNEFGLLVRTKQPDWIGIRPSSETGRRVYVRGTLRPDGTLEGTVNVRDRGYPAIDTRRSLRDKTPSSFLKEDVLGHLTDVSLSEVTVDNQDTLSRPVETSGKFELSGYARQAGNLLYLKPRLVPAVKENPFERKEREFPVDFPHPEKETYILSLHLPEGYSVKDTPSNRRVEIPDGKGSYTQLFQAQGRQVVMRSTLEITGSKFEPGRYKALRELYTRLVSAQSEQIVFEKTSGDTASPSGTGE